MTLSHRYQNFGVPVAQVGHTDTTATEKIEEDKLQSFENGYQSGWDDAVAAQSTTRDNITAEFAQNLQEISFGYFEARMALARELRSVIEPVLAKLLPSIARDTLHAHILEKIESEIKSSLDIPVEIAVSPSRVVTLQSLLEETLKAPYEIIPDNTLLEDQVFLRLGQCEYEIDFEPWLQQVNDAVTTYFSTIGKT